MFKFMYPTTLQQGIRGIFVGFPEDSSGWLFYVPSARKTYISLDAVFDENFTSPLSISDLPFQGYLKMRGSSSHIFITETLTEVTGPPTVENESFPEELITISPENKPTEDISNVLSCYEYSNTNHISKSSYNNSSMISTDDSEEIKAYFTNMKKPSDLSYSEYLYTAHDINALNISEDKIKYCGINVSDFHPEPRSLSLSDP